jgi:hypothetical protein
MSNYGSLQKQTASRLEIGGCARHSRVDGCPISVSRSGLATEYYGDDGNLTVGGARSDLAGLVIAQLVVLWTVGAGAVWSARRSVAAHSVRQVDLPIRHQVPGFSRSPVPTDRRS